MLNVKVLKVEERTTFVSNYNVLYQQIEKYKQSLKLG